MYERKFPNDRTITIFQIVSIPLLLGILFPRSPRNFRNKAPHSPRSFLEFLIYLSPKQPNISSVLPIPSPILINRFSKISIEIASIKNAFRDKFFFIFRRFAIWLRPEMLWML